MVGAGLAGLSCALRLAGAGRRVTVFEREPLPGGRAGLIEDAGFRFDTGPTVLTMPDLIADALAAVGERMEDWLELTPLDPVYRASYADGSQLNIRSDPQAMAAEIEAVIGPDEARGYLRFVDFASRMYDLQFKDFIDRNYDSPLGVVTPNLARVAALGGFRRLAPKVGSYLKDPRTARAFSFQAMYAGMSPYRALALYAVISYLDCVAGVYAPRGGMHAVPAALARAAQEHGVRFHYGRAIERIEVQRSTGQRGGDRRRGTRARRRCRDQRRPAQRLPGPPGCAPLADQAAALQPVVLPVVGGLDHGLHPGRASHHPLRPGVGVGVRRPASARQSHGRPQPVRHQPDAERPQPGTARASTSITCCSPCPTCPPASIGPASRLLIWTASSPLSTSAATRGSPTRWR